MASASRRSHRRLEQRLRGAECVRIVSGALVQFFLRRANAAGAVCEYGKGLAPGRQRRGDRGPWDAAELGANWPPRRRVALGGKRVPSRPRFVRMDDLPGGVATRRGRLPDPLRRRRGYAGVLRFATEGSSPGASPAAPVASRRCRNLFERRRPRRRARGRREGSLAAAVVAFAACAAFLLADTKPSSERRICPPACPPACLPACLPA